MELTAAVEALKALKEPCEVEFFTDSQYVQNGICEWLKDWKIRGWKTKDKKAVKNEDLWRELDAESAKHKITWRWLKGHAGHDHGLTAGGTRTRTGCRYGLDQDKDADWMRPRSRRGCGRLSDWTRRRARTPRLLVEAAGVEIVR